MKKTSKLEDLQSEFTSLANELAALGWLSHGYAQNRGPGAGGPCYQWTRKEKGKTISVATSCEQYEAMATAIANWKKAKESLFPNAKSINFIEIPREKRIKVFSFEYDVEKIELIKERVETANKYIKEIL